MDKFAIVVIEGIYVIVGRLNFSLKFGHLEIIGLLRLTQWTILIFNKLQLAFKRSVLL